MAIIEEDNAFFYRIERIKKLKLRTQQQKKTLCLLDFEWAIRQQRIASVLRRIELTMAKLQQTKNEWGVK